MLHGNERVIKHKIGLLNLAEELGNVSKACQIMGFPGTPFTAIKEPSKKAVSMPCLIEPTQSQPQESSG